ncbi:hypothetical protein Bbelb_209620 [Branchiostoma belcheri]|nr:hypothetical protein Bbelb_209620 [Branchiostoma belcheri]
MPEPHFNVGLRSLRDKAFDRPLRHKKHGYTEPGWRRGSWFRLLCRAGDYRGPLMVAAGLKLELEETSLQLKLCKKITQGIDLEHLIYDQVVTKKTLRGLVSRLFVMYGIILGPEYQRTLQQRIHPLVDWTH